MRLAFKRGFRYWMLHSYLTSRLQHAFHAIHVRGLENLHSIDPDTPVLAFSNHTSWWDGIVVFCLSKEVRQQNFYAMMDLNDLRHYRYLSWIGACSVDLGNTLRAAVAIRYAIRLFEKNKSLVWIFPQGKMTPAHQPVSIRQGTHHLVLRAPHARLLPCAFRYESGKYSLPEVWIEILPSFPATESSDARIEQELRQAVRELDVALESENPRTTGFATLVLPRMTLSRKFRWIKLALQGKLKQFDRDEE